MLREHRCGGLLLEGTSPEKSELSFGSSSGNNLLGIDLARTMLDD
jgi:hypothetical protein